ncbi:discoidin domain-containing protein [Pseudoduganella namucuonensis]|uniref:F5/8 type C domain-containing protein n=1 Tax=Pseudoduganella namucuonensis TaxID=1035707 RepID=A0A1I7G7D3_9BURK|nr:discoidin domain-containing protein [Pseudoduganella namucuonensis]SFU44364.1 F5/8 type C domain-containing protein [Pseudoduganella namucuonensis]
MKLSKYGNTRTRTVASIFFAALMGMAVLSPPPAAAADTILTLATSYQPTIQETTDASGFKHPGVGLTKPILENLRTQIRAQKEPWNTNFNNMLLSSSASRTAVSSNRGSDPTKPLSYAFNSQSFNGRFIADGQKAFTQAILYYVTGDEIYRANALAILRIWAQMDPAQYTYFNDAHIHTGVPMYRMMMAAEILRYTSYQTPALQWTDADTANLTNNLIVPATDTFNHTNWRFMNQHLYPLMGSMAGYIFTGNRARYNEGVEWFTVNATAVDQGVNGAIKRLFRLVDTNDLTGEPVTPVVQLVEMGRDQAHSSGDLVNVDILSRQLMAQGTKVDPVNGTPSTAANAVGPYEFLNDRILDTADYWGRFMLGYETPWVPTVAYANADGTPRIVYKTLSSGYRGRLTQNSWGSYYYYKYARGFNMDQRAPYLTEAYRRRPSYNWDNVDGGGEFWFYIPAAAAEAEGAQFLVRPIVDPLREIEDRATALDGNSTVIREATVGYARVTATAAGSTIALTSYANSSKNVAFRVRTNGIATLEAFGDSIALPDTKGQWRYVTYALNAYQGIGDMFHITVKGAGTTVDLDHINLQPGTALTAPVFAEGDADLNLYTYAASTSTINRSFAATDANAGDVVSYQIDNMPAGATFNTGTGAFSWKPSQAGTYTFAITATDGATVSTRLVKVVVTADRQSAVAAANAAFQAGTTYISASLSAYYAAHADAVAAINGATDDTFAARLTALGNAVAGLQPLTPVIDDGSLDYSKMLASSTFGSGVSNALDNAPDTFIGYFLAQNLAHTLDFGAGYRVSASSFQVQVRASFPTRIGNAAMFGSNDNETWTRLTPGVTVDTEDMQTLEVQDDLKEKRFRFIRIQKFGSSNQMLELSEFRIFGARHEAVNKLSAVSIGSDQRIKTRIVPGNTVKVTITAVAPINNLRLTVLGQPVAVTTADNLNWTASWVASATADITNVKFVLDYKTAEGFDADTTYFTTDGSALFISDQTNYLGNLDIAALTDSSGRNATDVRTVANLLFDGNINSATDFRVNGSGYGGYLTFDFKEDGSATLSRAELLARQDQVGRAAGTVVQGSNDNASWTTMSSAAVSSAEWQQLAISNPQPYRYVRIYNGGNWFGNMAELRLHGVARSQKMAAVSISSPQSLRSRIVPGNAVKLTFATKEAANNVSVTVQGQAATVATTDNVNFTASVTLPQGVATGPVVFAIKYKLQSGMDGITTSATTDGTTLYLVDESDVIRNVPAIATLIDSTVNRTAAATLTQVNALFDGALGSVSDFRTGADNSGSGGYITFDFKEGGSAALSGVDLLSRQDGDYARIAGTVVQGSNDNASWTTISGAATSSAEWQQLAINPQPYRYIRIYNGGNWFGNMAELRLRGVAQSNRIATVSIGSPQSLRNRIAAGNSVKVTFTAKEAVTNVSATIQGQAATVATADNVNFTATATLPQGVATGTVTFALNYKLQSGMNGVATTATTDGTTLYVADESDVIRNVPAIATLIDSTVNRSAAVTLSTVNNMFDGLASASDFRTGTTNSGYGAYIIFDFKEDGSATLTGVDLLGRQDQYYTRIAGTVVQGSNDNASWTTISGAAVSSAEWQRLAINPQPYRYIRIYNGGNWFGNIAELRLRGAAQSNRIATVSINSPQSLRNRVVPGNTVQLAFTAKEAVNNVSATIQGQAAAVTTTDNVNFTATATLPQGVAPGAVTFAVNYKLQSGMNGVTTTATTDGTALYLVDESDVIRNLSTLATLIDSTVNRPAATTAAIVNNLFDGNLGTISDFRTGTNNAGNGAYVTFDFTGNEAILTSVELAARQDNYYTRANGVVIQGSNDNTNWSALTAPAASTMDWQTLPVTGGVPYRYIRIYNGGAWFGNLSEVRFHGAVQPN